MLDTLDIRYPHGYAPDEVPFPTFVERAAGALACLQDVPPDRTVIATAETVREILDSSAPVFADCGLVMGLLLAERNPDALDSPLPLTHPRHVATPEDARHVHYVRPTDDATWELARSFSSFHGHWVFNLGEEWLGGSIDGPVDSRSSLKEWTDLLALRIWFDATQLPAGRRDARVGALIDTIRMRALRWTLM